MSKNLKLSIYTEINGEVDYEVTSDSPVVFLDHCWNIEHLAGTTKKIHVKVSRVGEQSHLQITKVFLNSIQLNNFTLWSNYIDSSTGQRKEHTYGYINQPGEYVLKIRQNPLVHNYISYFLSISAG
jgi:hypothetical protein